MAQNALLIAYFAVAATGTYSIQAWGLPIASIAYLAFAALMLLVVLRKRLCTSYYYGKLCSIGWGKLSSTLFPKNLGSYELGKKLAPATWFALIAVP